MIFESNDEELKNLFIRGELSIVADQTAYSYFILNMPILITDKFPKSAEVWTNGRMIVINTAKKEGVKKILEEVTPEQLLLHEASHTLLNHGTRQVYLIKKGYSQDVINIAQDFIINENLGIVNPDLTYEQIKKAFSLKQSKAELLKMSFEEIVETMAKSCQSESDLSSLLNSNLWSISGHIEMSLSDETVDNTLKGEMEKNGFNSFEELIDEKIKESLIKYHGKQSGSIWKELELKLFKNTVDWKELLKEQISSFKSQQDSDEGTKIYSRRNLLFHQQRVNMPLQYNHKRQVYDGIVIATDTSGSISDDNYVSEISEGLSLLLEEKVSGNWVTFDVDIKKEVPFNQRTNISSIISKLKNRVYGGTSFVSVFNYAVMKKAKLLIIFSDLDAEYPLENKYPFKTIFITHSENIGEEQTARKFGKIIKIKD
jgi:predicted metal-dependent peptidase